MFSSSYTLFLQCSRPLILNPHTVNGGSGVEILNPARLGANSRQSYNQLI
jgi:hypothetical protein